MKNTLKLLLLLLLLQSFQILARLPSSLLFCREFLFNSSLQTCAQDELEERKNIRASSKSAALSAPMSATLSAILASHVLQETPFHTYSN
jgi:hypothetical protein